MNLDGVLCADPLIVYNPNAQSDPALSVQPEGCCQSSKGCR